ncbi:MAG: type II secretion system minor pseudopilin GspK, partial [Pseudomonadota bacterium]|nr:type II secretion system minor pseudopilin GspK [Pseudomonadota bacterium]
MVISAARGVALITALLVVALTTVLAVAMMTQQQLTIRRTMNLINRDQAYCYALGAEQWSQQLLLRDDPEIDSLDEHWATPLPPLPIPGGSLQGQLEDLQARFNLNNLILSTPESLTAELKFFERLLSVLELPTSLAQVVLDWLDDDITPQVPHGAEDDRYLIKTPAYRAANGLFKSPSEIRLLAGIDAQKYEKLIPYISTLPTLTAININTAPLPILRALTDNLDEAQGQQLI